MEILELTRHLQQRLYAIHDSNPDLKSKGAFSITPERAPELNKQGYGIFWTANEFENKERTKDKLKHIHFWLADIDKGTKAEQLKKILALRIKPTMIVETKRGYHCYWKAKDGTKENYTIIEMALIRLLDSDIQCKDTTRLLRAIGYNHCKEPNNPFKVDIIHFDNREITEKEMLYIYGIPEQLRQAEEKAKKQAEINKQKAKYKKYNNQYGINDEERILNNIDNFFYNNTMVGNRNYNYFIWACKYKALNRPITEIISKITEFNNRIDGIPQAELEKTIQSAYKGERTFNIRK